MFTVNKFTEYVNQALNYPAVRFDDIRLFLDQAISEINTELHTSIVDLDAMEDANRKEVEKLENIVPLTSIEVNTNIPSSDTEPVLPKPSFYYNNTTGLYYILKGSEYSDGYPYLIGVCVKDGVPTYYKSGAIIGCATKVWYRDDVTSPVLVDLENYFTVDWIKLFLIPYVCYKYSIRDGDTGRLFNEEFAQGFSQLRKSYNVPFQVVLASVAHLFAYREDVTHHLPKLNIWCPTRAITENMKNAAVVNAQRMDFYDRSGFNI